MLYIENDKTSSLLPFMMDSIAVMLRKFPFIFYGRTSDNVVQCAVSRARITIGAA